MSTQQLAPAERAIAPLQVAIATQTWTDPSVIIRCALDASQDAHYDELAEQDLERSLASMRFPS